MAVSLVVAINSFQYISIYVHIVSVSAGLCSVRYGCGTNGVFSMDGWMDGTVCSMWDLVVGINYIVSTCRSLCDIYYSFLFSFCRVVLQPFGQQMMFRQCAGRWYMDMGMGWKKRRKKRESSLLGEV